MVVHYSHGGQPGVNEPKRWRSEDKKDRRRDTLLLFVPPSLQLIILIISVIIILYSNCVEIWGVISKKSRILLPSPRPSTDLGCPHLSSMTRLLSAAFLSCSFFSSSAAFLRRSNWKRENTTAAQLWDKRVTQPSWLCTTHPEFLLPLRGHETLLLLALRLLDQPGADLCLAALHFTGKIFNGW